MTAFLSGLSPEFWALIGILLSVVGVSINSSAQARADRRAFRSEAAQDRRDAERRTDDVRRDADAKLERTIQAVRDVLDQHRTEIGQLAERQANVEGRLTPVPGVSAADRGGDVAG